MGKSAVFFCPFDFESGTHQKTSSWISHVIRTAREASSVTAYVIKVCLDTCFTKTTWDYPTHALELRHTRHIVRLQWSITVIIIMSCMIIITAKPKKHQMSELMSGLNWLTLICCTAQQWHHNLIEMPLRLVWVWHSTKQQRKQKTTRLWRTQTLWVWLSYRLMSGESRKQLILLYLTQSAVNLLIPPVTQSKVVHVLEYL